MKLRPILFSTEMVQAILAGRKTQTRRVVKHEIDSRGLRTTNVPFEDFHGKEVKCPYGQVGDVLWVRETWAPALGYFAYKADYTAETLALPENKGLWKPSIHMPFKAARIFLQITNIRVERLQDITENDAIAEGVEIAISHNSVVRYWKDYVNKHNSGVAMAGCSFMTLWKSINGAESWESNPWVWVVEFERIEKPKP